MIEVNGVNIDLYAFDTDASIRRRVAVSLNTLTEYILWDTFPTVSKLKNSQKYKIDDMIDYVKRKSDAFEIDYSLFRQHFAQLYSSTDQPEEFVKLWLSFSAINDAVLLFVDYQIAQEHPDLSMSVSSFVNDLYGEKADFLYKFNQKLLQEEKDDASFVAVNKQVEQIIPNKISPLRKISTTYSVTLFTQIPLSKLFEKIRLSKSVVYACMDKTYTVSSFIDTVPAEDWADAPSNTILLKHVLMSGNKNEYVNILVYSADDIRYEFDVKVEDDSFVHIIIDNISQALNIPENVEKNTQIVNTTGVFNSEVQAANTYVFLDMVMNNTLFSEHLSISEQHHIPKFSRGAYLKYDEKLSIVVEFISSSVASVRLRNIAPDMVENVRSYFALLFSMYDKEFDNISEFYTRYIPNFSDYTQIPEEILPPKISEYPSDLFISNYARQCRYRPSVIPAAEVDKYAEQGFHVMPFPKATEGSTVYNYICDHPVDKYPGLKANNLLPNKIQYPLIPCCYKEDQRRKINSLYNQYYNKDTTEKKSTGYRYVGKTLKITKPDQLFLLPENISNLLSCVCESKNVNYVRRGVFKSPYSFVECLLKVRHIDSAPLEYMRQQNFQESDFAETLQENYGMSLAQIGSELFSGTFVDPRKYIKLFEKHFDCNIYLIYSPRKGDSQFILPNYINGYLRYKPNLNRDSYIIYMHYGSEFDKVTDPQCEIAGRRSGENTIHSFKDVSQLLETFYSKHISSFSGLNWVYCPDIDVSENMKLLGQYVDTSGKTRVIRISTDFGTFDLETDPLPPLNVNLFEEDEMVANDGEALLRYLMSSNAALNFQKENRDTKLINYIDFNLFDIHMGAHVREMAPITDVNSQQYTEEHFAYSTYVSSSTASAKIYNHFLYFWSEYTKKHQISISNLAPAFSAITVDPKISYSKIPADPAKTAFITEDGNFVVKTRGVAKNLIRKAALEITRNPDIFEFKPPVPRKRKLVNDQLTFTSFDDCVWYIMTKNIPSVLSDSVNMDAVSPYFFSNKRVSGGSVFLTREFSTLKSAAYCGEIWHKSHRILHNVDNTKSISKIDYTLYVYNTRNNIVKIRHGNTPIIVMAYKYNGSVRYISLI